MKKYFLIQIRVVAGRSDADLADETIVILFKSYAQPLHATAEKLLRCPHSFETIGCINPKI